MPSILRDSVEKMLARAKEEMREPDYICIDPKSYDILVPDKQFAMSSPASGVNMSGDAFLMGIPVVFVKKAGFQFGYRNPRRMK